MNRIGLSGKYSDEAILLTALIGNFVQGRRIDSRLQKLIEQANKQKAKSRKKSLEWLYDPKGTCVFQSRTHPSFGKRPNAKCSSRTDRSFSLVRYRGSRRISLPRKNGSQNCRRDIARSRLMTSTLQLTPAAAARMFAGPRYRHRRTRLTPDRARQALYGIACQFQESFNPWIVRLAAQDRALAKTSARMNTQSVQCRKVGFGKMEKVGDFSFSPDKRWLYLWLPGGSGPDALKISDSQQTNRMCGSGMAMNLDQRCARQFLRQGSGMVGFKRADQNLVNETPDPLRHAALFRGPDFEERGKPDSVGRARSRDPATLIGDDGHRTRGTNFSRPENESLLSSFLCPTTQTRPRSP